MTTPTPARDAVTPGRPAEQSPARAAARGVRFTSRRARGARRRGTSPAQRPAVPPVERANGWLVGLAVLGAAVLFSVLAMNAFMGG